MPSLGGISFLLCTIWTFLMINGAIASLPSPGFSCSSSPHLHPNGSFSRDFRSGLPKLSRFGLPGFWTLITLRPELGAGRGLSQSCSFLRELSNGVLHFTYTHRNRVDSRLLVVQSQIVSLTPGPSFDHNLCCRCPNGSCKAILDIYTSRTFQRYKERLNARCFDPCNRAMSFQESRRTPKSHFRECECRPHTSLKVGLRQIPNLGFIPCTFLQLWKCVSHLTHFWFHGPLHFTLSRKFNVKVATIVIISKYNSFGGLLAFKQLEF